MDELFDLPPTEAASRETRAIGLTVAVELDADVLAADPELPEAVRRQGVLSRVLRGVALRVSPPLVITEAEIGALVDVPEAALPEVGTVVGTAAAARR